MVSMAQFSAEITLGTEGWISVSGPEQDDPADRPIGGPQIMMNREQRVIIVYADGSTAILSPLVVRTGDPDSMAARVVAVNRKVASQE